tara:strand:+ start:27903 stop:29675 length:1773 start_codon:yes stop_codon:yes gene_type:complete
MRALLASLLLLASSLCLGQGLSQGVGQAFGSGTSAGNFGAAHTQPDFLPVEEAYQIEIEITGQDSLRVYWQIADTYYLYKHRFAFSLSDGDGDIPLTANYPPALERTDEFFGEVEVYYNRADIKLTAQRAPTTAATLKVTSQGCADAGLCYPPEKQTFALDFSNGRVSEQAQPALQTSRAAIADNRPDADTVATASLLYMLLLAFIGGSILNLMPCVFPILSLKVLSFARSTDHDRHLQSWVYTAGVIASFVLVAAVLIGLQQAGQAVGWGFQLQSPGFVITLAYLFVAMGLSLSGMIELGGSVMNTGGGLASRQGLSGSFFTGVLAVVVASPCTAPFMGTALGFAITQPPQVGLLVFAALGAGMAAPLLLFSYSGAARRLMPRPGPWMETLKQFLAFPLYATAIWLLWVAGRQTGVNTMAVALAGALTLALGLWLWRTGSWRKLLAITCIGLAVLLGSWRETPATADEQLSDSRVWSDARVTQLREQGLPVFVDVTADWCITCIANETAVLYTDDITRAFADHGVTYLVADWTNYDADIAALLERHGRTGIPLYLMYPADTSLAPRILPQILTRATVKAALEEVSPKNG